jgi:hypothetical protein
MLSSASFEGLHDGLSLFLPVNGGGEDSSDEGAFGETSKDMVVVAGEMTSSLGKGDLNGLAGFVFDFRPALLP